MCLGHMYLYGRHFTLRTDHLALTALLATTGSGHKPLRLYRWSERLQAYNFATQFTTVFSTLQLPLDRLRPPTGNPPSAAPSLRSRVAEQQRRMKQQFDTGETPSTHSVRLGVDSPSWSVPQTVLFLVCTMADHRTAGASYLSPGRRVAMAR